MNELAGMTHEKWIGLPESERQRLRPPAVPLQLAGLEGWRVEVVTTYGETRRFYVGKSTGWSPVYLEVKTRRSMGGHACESKYTSVRKLYRRNA